MGAQTHQLEGCCTVMPAPPSKPPSALWGEDPRELGSLHQDHSSGGSSSRISVESCSQGEDLALPASCQLPPGNGKGNEVSLSGGEGVSGKY